MFASTCGIANAQKYQTLLETIAKIKSICAHMGLQVSFLMTFASHTMQEFAHKWDIKVIYFNPYKTVCSLWSDRYQLSKSCQNKGVPVLPQCWTSTAKCVLCLLFLNVISTLAVWELY